VETALTGLRLCIFLYGDYLGNDTDIERPLENFGIFIL